MAKQILSLDSLYNFFVDQNQSVNFSSKDKGTPIVVTTPGTFAVENDSTPGLLSLLMRVAHTETNRNKSHISEENMKKHMGTLKYRPVLAYIHQLPDNTWDFYAHNMEVIKNEDGEEEIHYLEKQVGCFTSDEPYLEYDKEMDKTYVMAKAVIPEEYTKAADIIREKGGTKISCELVINELSYNAKEKYLDLTDFYFSGVSLLGRDDRGEEIQEGMLGARADIADFCHKEPIFVYQEKLIDTLEKLNVTLSSFNKNSEEGGNKEMDNVTNEFVEEVVETEVEETVVENNEVEETEVVEETETSASENGDETPVEEKFTKNFTVELSHGEIQYALYNLLGVYEEADNDWYFIRDVYDNYFYMQGWCNAKIFKQGYSIDGENVALEGERQEMFEMILSESEKIAIEKLRADYSALETKYNELVEFKANYDAAQIKEQKDAIFAKVEYECLAENAEFKKLVEDAEKYSVDEISTKADLIFAQHVKTTMQFSAGEIVKPHAVSFNLNEKPNKKKQAYKGLFNEDN